MQALLTVIVTWLSVNFGLPATHDLPKIEIVASERMAEVRFDRVASSRPNDAAIQSGDAAAAAAHAFQAIYDDASQTIYLPRGWSGATPGEVSLLVHELVHHLQNLSNLQYDCAEAREKPAYRAQAEWLELFGTTLEDEFDLDAMTVLVRTNCLR